MRRGFSSVIRWKVQPSPAMTRGEYDSTITSHQASSLSMIAWPASVVGSAVKLRLPVLMSLKKPVESKTPSWKAEGVTPRIGSALRRPFDLDHICPECRQDLG